MASTTEIRHDEEKQVINTNICKRSTAETFFPSLSIISMISQFSSMYFLVFINKSKHILLYLKIQILTSNPRKPKIQNKSHIKIP